MEMKTTHWKSISFTIAIAGLIVLFFYPLIGIGLILFGIAWIALFVMDHLDAQSHVSVANMKLLEAILNEIKKSNELPLP